MTRILLFLSLIIWFSSCDNTLNVNAEYKDLPIVYGLLNPFDTAQYIKLERVFQTKDESAIDVAQNIDSLYYPNAKVSLVNRTTMERVELVRIDGNLDGYPRKDGVFAKDPNYLYKIKTDRLDMSPGDEFELEILRDENKELVTSIIRIVEEPHLIAPQATGSLHFSRISKLSIKRKKSDYGKSMDVIFYLNVHEVDHQLGTSIITRLEWKVLKAYTKLSYSLDGTLFYTFLADNLEENANITRTLLSVDLKVVLAGEEITDFVKLGQANLFSITSSESIPNFSNLSEGYGVFSSLNEIYNEGYGLSVPTMDSLENGVITKNYNFTQ